MAYKTPANKTTQSQEKVLKYNTSANADKSLIADR